MSTTDKNVSVYHWPYCQICLQCKKGLLGEDDENGTVTGLPLHTYVVCLSGEQDNDGRNCPGLKE